MYSQNFLLDLHHHFYHLMSSHTFLSFYSLNFGCTGLSHIQHSESYITHYLCIMLFCQKNSNLNSWTWLILSLHLALSLICFSKDNPGLPYVYWNQQSFGYFLVEHCMCLLLSTHSLVILYSFLPLLFNINSPIII